MNNDPAHEVESFVAQVDDELVDLANYLRFTWPSSGSTGIALDDLFAAPLTRGLLRCPIVGRPRVFPTSRGIECREDTSQAAMECKHELIFITATDVNNAIALGEGITDMSCPTFSNVEAMTRKLPHRLDRKVSTEIAAQLVAYYESGVLPTRFEN